MAALKLHRAALLVLVGGFVLISAGWARGSPDRNDDRGHAPAQNAPPAVEPKPPAPGEAKTGVINPPNVDPSMAERVPNVDPRMPKPPKPQAPKSSGNQGNGEGGDKSAPQPQPR